MTDTLEKKISEIKVFFNRASNREEKYSLILELGRSLEPFPEKAKKELDRVEGCQSATYLTASCTDGKMHFQGSSDALISAGLIALLFRIYNEETPETILKHPPVFLNELGLNTILSPLRSGGLGSMYKKMRSLAQKQLKKPVL
ncbi:MAG: SufE family protein [Parachlamydiales bacterium]|jgi:cysteine desulfuration protein SufE